MIFTVVAEMITGSVGGLFMVSLLAALLTGATSFLLSGAISISKDSCQGRADPTADDRRVLTLSRLSVGCMAALGLLIALCVEDVIARLPGREPTLATAGCDAPH